MIKESVLTSIGGTQNVLVCADLYTIAYVVEQKGTRKTRDRYVPRYVERVRVWY